MLPDRLLATEEVRGHLSLGSPPLPSTPEQALRSFAEALGSCDLDAATYCFARDACFLTRDATLIHGREEIRGILAQLIAMRLQVQVEQRSMLPLGDVALSSERWRMRFGAAAPFEQISQATIVLRLIENRWKLLLAAPWGFATTA
jgi:ketosteroid isomerase-like protein